MEYSNLFGDKRIKQKLWNRITVDESTGCWIWPQKQDKRGYTRVFCNNKVYLGHRFFYITLIGDPGELQLDHLCRVKSCVNPLHLEPVSCKENLMRGVTLAAANSKKTACPKGHPYSEKIVNGKTERFCRTCNREYERIRRNRMKIPNH